MKAAKLSSLTGSQLVERLVSIGTAQDHARKFGEYSNYEQLYAQLTAVHQELLRRGPDTMNGLTKLYQHDNPQVRLIAAVLSFDSAPKLAQDALRELAEGEFMPQCQEAHFAEEDIANGIHPVVADSIRPVDYDAATAEKQSQLLEPIDLSRLSIEELISRFVDIGVAQEQAHENDETEKNKLLDSAMNNIDRELRDRGKSARLALKQLYEHSNAQVRMEAARLSYGVAPEAARACLQALRDSKLPPQYYLVGSILRAIDHGKLT